jgi:hypothetical protein
MNSAAAKVSGRSSALARVRQIHGMHVGAFVFTKELCCFGQGQAATQNLNVELPISALEPEVYRSRVMMIVLSALIEIAPRL